MKSCSRQMPPPEYADRNTLWNAAEAVEKQWNSQLARRWVLMNPKTLQYIMGHADISVTLNTYTHVNFDDAKEEVYRIANS